MSDQQYDNTNKIILFVNKSDNKKAPVLTGFLYNENGVKREVALWPATDQQGQPKTTAKGSNISPASTSPAKMHLRHLRKTTTWGSRMFCTRTDKSCSSSTRTVAFWCQGCLLAEVLRCHKELNRLEEYLCPSCEHPKMKCEEVSEHQLCGGPCDD